MTIVLLLLIILFLTFFIYFSDLNPQDITVVYFADHSFSTSLAVLLVGCLLVGLAIGIAAHLFSSFRHQMKHWKQDRVEKKSRDISAIYREGVGRLLSGDLKKAHALLQKALDRDPSRIETYIAMASVHLQEGDPVQGTNVLLKAKELDPRSLEVLFKLATAYQEGNQDDEACKIYQEILTIEGSNRKALRSLRDLHIKHQRWQDALDLQKRILKTGPAGERLEEEKQKLLSLRYEIAHQALGEGREKTDLKEFNEIVKQNPNFTPARVSLGDVYQAMGRNEEAARVWQEGYLALGQSIFLSRLEDLYLEAEDPATLLSFYRSAIAQRGDDLMFRLFYGRLCLRLEMVDEAMEQLHEVESAGVDFPKLHLLLGEAHRRRNRIDEAVTEYQKALGVDYRLRFGYLCNTCGEPSSDWESRCQQCGTWGSLILAGRQAIAKSRPSQAEARAIHHGEREA